MPYGPLPTATRQRQATTWVILAIIPACQPYRLLSHISFARQPRKHRQHCTAEARFVIARLLYSRRSSHRRTRQTLLVPSRARGAADLKARLPTTCLALLPDSALDCVVTTVRPSMHCLLFSSPESLCKWFPPNPSAPAMLKATASRTLSPSLSVAPAALASPPPWSCSNGR